MQIDGTGYIELYVGNAYQSAHFYRTVLGFQPVAYAGPETSKPDQVSYSVRQGAILLLLTSPVHPYGPIAQHLHCHGEGIRDIALTVSDVAKTFEIAVRRGATPLMEPQVERDDFGQVTTATIRTFGDTVHTLIDRSRYRGTFLPGYHDLKPLLTAKPGINEIDHIAVAVQAGGTERWSQFYQNVFGFDLLMEEHTSTDYSSMKSKVVRSVGDKITLVFVEPSSGKRKSPIEEYLSFYDGDGVHHLALSSSNIVSTVRTLRENGLEFTHTPTTYYEDLPKRFNAFTEDLNDLRDLGILMDNDESGYLLQIFSQPIQGRPTFFFEIIQRLGAQGFGNGNIKALFEAIERAQLMRGNV